MNDPTTPPPRAEPPQPGRAGGPAGGPGVGLTAVVLLAVSAGMIFWAGLSMGGTLVGRSDQEREAVEAFTETYRIIVDDYIGTPAPESLLQGAIEGMFDVLEDPHSGYMPPDAYDAALDDARGEFEGIGAVMATEDDGGDDCDVIDASCRLRVIEVLVGAPAEDAGLEPGDIVTFVDGAPLSGTSIDDSVGLIRGPRGTDVTLTLVRDGDELDLTITRDAVISDDVHSASLADGRIGYVAVDNFSPRAAEDFREALQEHLDAGVAGLVLDVRDDPGGFVDATVAISSHFLEDGAVFWEEDASGTQMPVDAIDPGLMVGPEVAVVVLVNGRSASASEILGGALQDAGRARLVGEPTFGKGTVQEWTELPGESGGFRLSVAKWLTRDKRWVHGEGLSPDVPVEGTGVRYRAADPNADPEADDQLQAAVATLLGEPLPGAAPSPAARSAGG